MRRDWTTIGLGILLVTLAVFAFVPNFIRPRYHYAKSSCIANLKQIEGAKATWALENHKSNTDQPSMTDLVGPTLYIRDFPVCEQGGGTYTIGRVSEKPRCSIPHHSLELGYVYVFDESRQPLTGASVFAQGAVSNGAKLAVTNGWFEPGSWATTETNGLGRVNYCSGGATGFAAFKLGYTTSSVPLTTTWPAKIVLRKLPP